MIRFFREIRRKLLTENKFSKYMIYALGEIVLVVIGILIAINLNNLNEERSLKKNVDYQLGLLRHSVYEDSIMMQGLIDYSIRQREGLEQLIQLLHEPMNTENCDNFLAGFANLMQIRTSKVDRAIYDQMVSSGVFSQIDKQELKSQIATYYQLAEHFNDIIWQYARELREFNSRISISGTIAKSYFDENSRFSQQDQCGYVTALLEDTEKKLILENFFYTGIDTYKQIQRLYSIMLNNVMTGLPEKSAQEFSDSP